RKCPKKCKASISFFKFHNTRPAVSQTNKNNMAADDFHSRHGRLIFLSNGNKSARRRNPGAEFNHGLVFSKHTLKENEMFEIRVDRIINSWSGSLAIGVTTANPNNIEIPSSAAGLKNGYWIMSGVSVIKDGVTVLDNYGRDLDELSEGDIVGVCRRHDGCLHFFVNGNDFGVACSDVPSTLYAVVDLYGKCVEVSSYKDFNPASVQPQATTASIAFHPHCGSLVKLSNNYRTAERQTPDEEFKNSVVLTSKALENDKLFEIKVEKLTDIWAGSLEVGVTTHNPVDIVLPPTMTMMPTGTWIWSATSIIVNGQEMVKDYSVLSLESIKVCDTVGIMRKSTGCLHFYLNGIDMGVAMRDIPTKKHSYFIRTLETLRHKDDIGKKFDSLRALEEFNHAVILTSRTLNPGELFEVFVDRQVDKWAGSLEIGLTTHNPEVLELPSTMTNVRSGTWIMSGGGMVKNGSTEIEDYGKNLDELKAGDRVGVIYSEDGTVHFYVNGEDMGEAANDVPQNVYGVLDLYGRSAQATITNGRPREEIPDVDTPEQTTTSTQETTPAPPPQEPTPTPPVSNENWFTLSDKHGDQVAVSQDCRAAVRINPLVEFNNAIVMSNRPLRDDEMFEVIVISLVDRWSGSLEAGVTSTSPAQLSFPTTMTDLDHDTWMLSGSSVLQDGVTIQNGYACDLDKLREGHRLGIMRKSDSTIHFFINGEDCGVAASSVPSVTLSVMIINAIIIILSSSSLLSVTLSVMIINAIIIQSSSSLLSVTLSVMIINAIIIIQSSSSLLSVTLSVMIINAIIIIQSSSSLLSVTLSVMIINAIIIIQSSSSLLSVTLSVMIINAIIIIQSSSSLLSVTLSVMIINAIIIIQSSSSLLSVTLSVMIINAIIIIQSSSSLLSVTLSVMIINAIIIILSSSSLLSVTLSVMIINAIIIIQSSSSLLSVTLSVMIINAIIIIQSSSSLLSVTLSVMIINAIIIIQSSSSLLSVTLSVMIINAIIIILSSSSLLLPLSMLHHRVYAIIDLYGRCVELAIYDEDFTRRSSVVTSTESQTTATAATTENEKDQ
ncbi:hypothetical protein QZH41_013738, partial [Actinostola sp. cb2023]